MQLKEIFHGVLSETCRTAYNLAGKLSHVSPMSKDDWRFEIKTAVLSDRYFSGEISLGQALSIAKSIDERGVYSPRNMMERLKQINRETAERMAAPLEPTGWRRFGS